MRPRRRDVVALVAWTSLLVVALAGLHALGDGPLGTPPADGIGTWIGHRGAATALFALVRLALLVVGWYLLVATFLATSLRLFRADAPARAVEACAPMLVRRLVRAAAGLSLAASVVASSTASASEGVASVPVMRRLPDAAHASVEEDAVAVTMTRLPDIDANDPATPPIAPGAPPAPPAPATWTVVPGDHLWSIARRTLAAAWRAEPSDAEIDPYWRALVELNRPRLPDPRNADLIVPAMIVELPAPPTR